MPASRGDRGDPPAPGGKAHLRGHRILPQDRRIAEEGLAVADPPIPPDQHQVEPEAGIGEAARPVERLLVDDGGDDAPEPPRPAGALVDEDRRPRDEAAPALDQVDRPRQHGLVEIPCPRHRLHLARQRTVVEADDRPARLQWIDHAHHQVRRCRERANCRKFGDQLLAQPAELRLIDAGLIPHHPGQRPRYLDIGVQRPLQVRAQHAEPVLHLRPGALLERRLAALLVDLGQNQHREHRNRRREIGKPHHRAPRCFDLLHDRRSTPQPMLP